MTSPTSGSHLKQDLWFVHVLAPAHPPVQQDAPGPAGQDPIVVVVVEVAVVVVGGQSQYCDGAQPVGHPGRIGIVLLRHVQEVEGHGNGLSSPTQPTPISHTSPS
jgi:hypothetical protein